MDYKKLGMATGAVFAVLMISGTIISILSTQLQCSKRDIAESFKQGSISAVFPSIVYGLSAFFDFIRHPFSSTIESFGIEGEKSTIIGVGYLVMLASWITTVWNIHNSEKAVCKPDEAEMTDFKNKLLADLAKKQAQQK
jgi:hypothetical protein